MFEICIDEDITLKIDGWEITVVTPEGDSTNVLTGLQAGQFVFELFSETVAARETKADYARGADLCGSTPATRCGAKCDC